MNLVTSMRYLRFLSNREWLLNRISLFIEHIHTR